MPAKPGAGADTTALPALPCACANLRRAARAVTQLYDEELRRFGLHTTQFTLLQFLALTGPFRQGRVGELLALDSTTLTRTLQPLLRQGWIRRAPGRDRRERYLELTAGGKAKLEHTRPHWERAQVRLRRALGGRKWSSLQAALRVVADAARQA